MTTYCHVCARPIEGPCSKEKIPPGVTSHAFFIKCQSCTSDYPGIAFADTAGRNPTRSSFEQSFYECSGCGSLFFCGTKGFPFARSNFGVECCPKCGQVFPTGEQIGLQLSDTAPPRAVMNLTGDTLEKMQPLYETLTELVPKHPTLSKVVTMILLVNTPKGHDVWVVHQTDFDFDTERAIIAQLRKLVDGALAFSSSGDLVHSLEGEGVAVIRQMDVGKDLTQAAGPKEQVEAKGEEVAQQSKRKWWQIWKS
jgi:hypothetical protein